MVTWAPPISWVAVGRNHPKLETVDGGAVAWSGGSGVGRDWGPPGIPGRDWEQVSLCHRTVLRSHLSLHSP